MYKNNSKSEMQQTNLQSNPIKLSILRELDLKATTLKKKKKKSRVKKQKETVCKPLRIRSQHK